MSSAHLPRLDWHIGTCAHLYRGVLPCDHRQNKHSASFNVAALHTSFPLSTISLCIKKAEGSLKQGLFGRNRLFVTLWNITVCHYEFELLQKGIWVIHRESQPLMKQHLCSTVSLSILLLWSWSVFETKQSSLKQNTGERGKRKNSLLQYMSELLQGCK